MHQHAEGAPYGMSASLRRRPFRGFYTSFFVEGAAATASRSLTRSPSTSIVLWYASPSCSISLCHTVTPLTLRRSRCLRESIFPLLCCSCLSARSYTLCTCRMWPSLYAHRGRYPSSAQRCSGVHYPTLCTYGLRDGILHGAME